jgi:hypothetical protein
LLIITFDEGEAQIERGATGVTLRFAGETCCNEQPGPNLGPFPQSVKIGSYTLAFQNFGGERTGTVLLSPRLAPGTLSDTPFNHYSLLKTLEDVFDIPEHLGYAAQPGLVGFFDCLRRNQRRDEVCTEPPVAAPLPAKAAHQGPPPPR